MEAFVTAPECSLFIQPIRVLVSIHICGFESLVVDKELTSYEFLAGETKTLVETNEMLNKMIVNNSTICPTTFSLVLNNDGL